VQYAHARIRSVMRAAIEAMPDLDLSAPALASRALERLTDEGEIGLVKKIAEWPRVIAQAAQAREPHRVAFYLHELASDFHGHWNRGKDLPQLRFINADDRLSTEARLALIHGIAGVLAAGLALLGVDAPEEMR